MWDAPEIGIVGPIPVRDGKSIAESTVPAHLLPSMPPLHPSPATREPGELPSQSWPQVMTWSWWSGPIMA